jgi:hypothetical protein
MIVGYGFMAHGYSEFVRGPEHFAEIPRALGVPIPGLMGWRTIAVELVGGLAMSIGARHFCAVGQHSIGSNLTWVCIYGAAVLRFPINQVPGSHLKLGSIGHARVRD